MSQAEALARAQSLREAILDQGVKACSIELVEGRAGSGWSDTRFVASMGHHIVSHRGQGLTPGLNLVKVGRTDLPGPLCNGYGGFDEIARIICMAWANHPGAGGPYTVPSGVIPENNGRPYLFGWEFEGGINIADFTDSYRTFMARCLAGTLTWLALEETSHLEHKTWAPGRKVDRLGYTLERARAEIATELDNPPPEEEETMFVSADGKKGPSSGPYVEYWQRVMMALDPNYKPTSFGTFDAAMTAEVNKLTGPGNNIGPGEAARLHTLLGLKGPLTGVSEADVVAIVNGSKIVAG